RSSCWAVSARATSQQSAASHLHHHNRSSVTCDARTRTCEARALLFARCVRRSDCTYVCLTPTFTLLRATTIRRTRMRRLFSGLITAVFIATLALVHVQAAVSGAIFTTVADGSEVNFNIYAAKEDVY